MTGFFIPHLADDPTAAEAEWQRYLRAIPAPPDSRRIYRLTYGNTRERFKVTVGEPRRQFKQKTGLRGGYIPNADFERYGRHTGGVVSAIIDTGDVIYVWSAPPHGVWANPAMVGRAGVTGIEFFDEASANAGTAES